MPQDSQNIIGGTFWTQFCCKIKYALCNSAVKYSDLDKVKWEYLFAIYREKGKLNLILKLLFPKHSRECIIIIITHS